MPGPGAGQQERWKLCKMWPGEWFNQPGGRAKRWGKRLSKGEGPCSDLPHTGAERSSPWASVMDQDNTEQLQQKAYLHVVWSLQIQTLTQEGTEIWSVAFWIFLWLGLFIPPPSNNIGCSKPHSSKGGMLAFFIYKITKGRHRWVFVCWACLG